MRRERHLQSKSNEKPLNRRKIVLRLLGGVVCVFLLHSISQDSLGRPNNFFQRDFISLVGNVA